MAKKVPTIILEFESPESPTIKCLHWTGVSLGAVERAGARMIQEAHRAGLAQRQALTAQMDAEREARKVEESSTDEVVRSMTVPQQFT